MENQANGLILVFVNEHPRSVLLLRAAKNKAKELNTNWRVVYIGDVKKDKEKANLTLQNITLAEQMGAEVDYIEANSTLRGILEIIRKYKSNNINIHFIYIGDDNNYKLLNKIKTSTGRKLRKKLDRSIKVKIIDLEVEKLTGSSFLFKKLDLNALSKFFWSIIIVSGATITSELLDYLTPHSFDMFNWNRPIIYMAACAFVAGLYGLLPGITAALFSYFMMNYFYVKPDFNMSLATTDAVNLTLFLSATILIALFVGKTHSKNDKLVLQMKRMQSLFKVYRASLNQRSRHDVLEELHKELSAGLDISVAFFLPTPMNPDQLKLEYPKSIDFTDEEKQSLDTCWHESKTTGYGSPFNPNIRYRFIPLITMTNEIGVFAVEINKKLIFDLATSSLLSLAADHIAFILERVELGQVMEESRVREEREKLRAMLLSSVSHDLKTPLASVIGSLSVIKTMNDVLSNDQRTTLIETALEEAQRLDSFITNILDMTRIESGQVVFKKEWMKPDDILTSVQKKLRSRLEGSNLVIKPFNEDQIEICMDSIMTTQALQNVLENAVKYTEPGTRIDISWMIDDRGLILVVRDHGKGIPESHLNVIFDKYTRILQQDRKVAGTGLGLAIAKLVMQAQKGNIIAENHPDGGAIFSLIFPIWREAKKQSMAA